MALRGKVTGDNYYNLESFQKARLRKKVVYACVAFFCWFVCWFVCRFVVCLSV